MAVGIRKWRRADSPDELIDGPPYIGMHLFVNESSVELMRAAIPWHDRLGQVTGDEVDFYTLGNPEHSDDVYRRRRTPELVRRDLEDTKNYQAELQRLGGSIDAEAILRCRASRRTAVRMGIPEDRLPCLAFRAWPDWPEPPVLPLRRDWYGSEPGRIRLLETLFSWLSERRINDAIGAGDTSQSAHSKLMPLIRDLTDTIEFAFEITPRAKKRQSLTTYVTLEQLDAERIDGSYCARLVVKRGKTVRERRIGLRQLFYLSRFLTCKKRSIDSRPYASIAEGDLVHGLMEWHTNRIRRIGASDLRRPHHRVQKEWPQFVASMEQIPGLQDRFKGPWRDPKDRSNYYLLDTHGLRLVSRITDIPEYLSQLNTTDNRR